MISVCVAGAKGGVGSVSCSGVVMVRRTIAGWWLSGWIAKERSRYSSTGTPRWFVAALHMGVDQGICVVNWGTSAAAIRKKGMCEMV